jgi:hypothetical protein
MRDNGKNIARKLVQDDFQKTIAHFLTLDAGSRQVIGYGADGLDASAPPGDGDRTLIPIHIGARGSLSKQRARVAAKVWREVTQPYPKGAFI